MRASYEELKEDFEVREAPAKSVAEKETLMSTAFQWTLTHKSYLILSYFGWI